MCTLGPSSSNAETLREMILAGMNVARLNFSHGTHEDHRRMVQTLRQVSKDTGRVVGILLDLQGPKVRVGRFKEGGVMLNPGARFTITGAEVEGTQTQVSTTHTGLSKDVHRDDKVLLDDGNIVLKVLEIRHPEVICEVVIGGMLKNNKGINLPGAALSVDTITEKDYRDVDFGLEMGVDFLAMSFVRHPSDVVRLREYLKKKGGALPIISKIEKPQALDHIKEIIKVSDGIMVARGDLGVELPPEKVPSIQKSIIKECNRQGRPVITATQMLESMIQNPRPTRAEASDVANAILDGSDAVMLSAESASGKYPVEAVAVMRRIIRDIESTRLAMAADQRRVRHEKVLPNHEGVAVTACWLADLVQAKAITTVTLTGSMAMFIAKERPSTPVYAISQFEAVLRKLSLVWGIMGIHMPELDNDIEQALRTVREHLVALNLISKGDSMVFTAGMPFSERQATNMVRVDVVR